MNDFKDGKTGSISIDNLIGKNIDNTHLIYSFLNNNNSGFYLNNRYKVIKKIGSGGFSVVYKAYDDLLKCHVAIKFINPMKVSDEKKFQRLKREIIISRDITDRRLIKIFSLEEYKGIHYLIMEYIEGETLDEYIVKYGKFKWSEFKPIFEYILKALRVLHNNNIVHRDIKPSNIMLTKDNQVKILDFGLVKNRNDLDKSAETGEIVGTLDYISPEQILGKEVDQRSDIYQLGLVLYKVLTNTPLFKGDNSLDLLIKHINSSNVKLKNMGNGIPDYVKFICSKMLESNRKKRFKNVDEILEILEKKEISFMNRLKFFLRFSIKNFFIFMIFLIFLFYLLFTNYIDSKTIYRVKIKNNKIIAKNKYGFKIWSKSYGLNDRVKSSVLQSPFTDISLNGKTMFLKNKQYLVNLIKKSIQNYGYVYDSSLSEDLTKDYISVLNNKGNLIYKESISNYFNLQNYSFSKFFRISEALVNDFDKDNKDEFIALFSHKLGYFPSALLYFDNFKKFVFLNPGSIYFKYFYNKKPYLLLYGNVNLLSDFLFVSVIDLSLINSKFFKFEGIPSYTIDSKNFEIKNDIFYYILPSFTRFTKNKIIKNNSIEFYNIKTGNKMDLYLNYELKENNNELVFKDRKEDLFKVYNLINLSLLEQHYYNYYNKAYDYIKSAFNIKINNPYLKSAMYFIKGNIELYLKRDDMALKSFNKGLKFYKYNTMIIQKLIELSFLRGRINESIDMLEKRFSDYKFFWRLADGTKLFKFYFYLSNGSFIKAKIIGLKFIKTNKIVKKYLDSIYDFIRADFENSLNNLKELKNNKICMFTVEEYKLLLARNLLMKNENDESYDIFRDFYANSINHKNEGGISYSYLLYLKGFKKESENIARRCFSNLLRKSNGDFKTKFWLFYDSYIYTKLMKLLNNREEYKRGLRILKRETRNNNFWKEIISNL